MSPPARRALVDHDDPVLPIVAQCRLLKIARSTLYYRPVPVSTDDLAVMRRMDELYADSGHRDQPIRLIVITCTGDRDHAACPT